MKLVLNGTEDEMFNMLRAYKMVAQRYPEGHKGSVGVKLGDSFYSVGKIKGGISVWVSK